MFGVAILFLVAGIWNIIALKKKPFWITIVSIELKIFGEAFSD
jgi:hypothetical protein